MKIIVAVAVLAAATALPAGAQPSRPARLAGVTTVTGVGAVAVHLQADTFGLRPGTAGVTLSTTGTSVALLLVREGPRSHAYQNLSLDVLSRKPDGCTDARSCWRREGLVGGYREGAAPSAPWSEAHFSGGRYVAYLLGEPGTRVTATIRAEGLSGRSAVRATTPVRARLTRQRVSDPLVARLDGSETLRANAPAGAFQILWTTATSAVAGLQEMRLCFDRAGEGAMPAPDQACTADVRPQLVGGTSEGGFGCFDQTVTQSPEGVQIDQCGTLNPLLPPGVYLARWSASRVGPSSAVGYLGVLVEYLRA